MIIIITVVNQSLQNSRGKETFNAFFVSHAGQMTQETLKYGVQKVIWMLRIPALGAIERVYSLLYQTMNL